MKFQVRTCESCALIKSVKTINRGESERTMGRPQRVYTDFWGPCGVLTPAEQDICHIYRRLHAAVMDLFGRDSYGALREVPRVAGDS
jgi:hypothetical protein